MLRHAQIGRPETRRASPRLARTVAPPVRAAGRAQPIARTRGDDVSQRRDGLSRQLARAVALRSARPVLQRAIIAIKAPGEGKAATDNTKNCLENLLVRDAPTSTPTTTIALTRVAKRGAAVGPEEVADLSRKLPALGATETLYILAHGSPQASTRTSHKLSEAATHVGGMDPAALGGQLLAWYGTQAYTGKIKLVACISAGSDPDVRGGETYAEALAKWFRNQATTNTTATFKPASIDGIIGVGWVDEVTSKQQSIPLGTYLGNPSTHASFAETDRTTRAGKLTAAYGTLGTGGTDARLTGKSKGTSTLPNPAKIRYVV